jgi:hypothetical protein
MTVDVLTEIAIRRSPAEVAAFAGDPDNAPKWYVNIDGAEWQTPRPLRPGSRITFTARFLGRALVYTYEIAEFVEGKRLVMRTAQGPFPMETTYTWEPLPDGSTRMTLRNRGTPSGFSRLLAPFMARAMRKANLADLAKLKKVLEA